MDKDDCKHSITIDGRWVKNSYYDTYGIGIEADEMEWVNSHEKPTTKDVDLFTYRCTQCDKKFKY